MVSGQDTVMAHGNGKRQYFRNCYIDGNTDYIYGSAIAVFDSCVLFNRDRVDGSTSSVFTAASTPFGQTYGYVFRDCLLPNNNGQTAYTLGRPWGNAAPPHTSELPDGNNRKTRALAGMDLRNQYFANYIRRIQDKIFQRWFGRPQQTLKLDETIQ